MIEKFDAEDPELKNDISRAFRRIHREAEEDEEESNYTPLALKRMRIRDAREYFAAHAPAEPDWFDIEFDLKEPVKPNRLAGILTEAENIKYCNEVSVWRNKCKEHRYFAWRWYYADQMIKTKFGN